LSSAQNIKAIGRDMKELPAGFNNASFAVGNFSRIVQDAPFSLLSGNLIAVSNNIDPLVHSFVQLRTQTGSNQAAFKALASSLTGTGGLLLGISLVNAALTFFSAQQSFAKKELEGFAKAQVDSNKEAGEEIAHLRVLAAVAANTASSTRDRKEAAEGLTKALKLNNVQLTEEEALNNKAAAAIGIATKAILERARARAIENRIAELSAQNLDRETKRIDLAEKFATAQKKANEEQVKARKGNRLAISSKEFNLANNAAERLKTKVEELDSASAKANEEITRLLTQATATPTTGGGTDKVVDLLKKRIEALQKLQSEAGLTHEQQIELAQLEIQLIKRDSIKLGFTPVELQERINAAIQKSFPNEQVTSRLRVRIIGELDPSGVSTDLSNQSTDINTALGLDKIDPNKLNPVIKALQAAAAAKKELLNLEDAEKFAGFITDKLGPVFTDLFANIATEGQGAFDAFIKAIGDLIKRLIAAALAAAALSAILNAIFPGLGGKASFKAIFGQLTGLKFAEGGLVTRPTFGVFGEAGPEAVIPLSRLPQIIGQAQSGGGAGGNFTARIVDGGRDLILIMQQANKTFGRNF
jgi:hypothetical protein